MYCGPGAIVAIALINPPAVRSCRRTASSCFGKAVVAHAGGGRPSLDRIQPIPLTDLHLSSDHSGALTPVRRCDAGVKLRHNFKSDQGAGTQNVR